MSDDAPDPEKPKELIPAYRDTFVHFLFGTPGNEPILLHLLNAFLESDGQEPAQSVEMRNPFNPATFITDKFTILDVKATDERGDIFVVEFQTSERKTFAKRLTYYGCRAFGGQLFTSDAYSVLKAVLAIAVTTIEMFPELEGAHNTFVLTAKADSRVTLTELLQMHILEVTKKKVAQAAKLPSALCAWYNFFFYSHQKSEVEMTTLLQEQPMVGLAYEKFQQFNRDERLRALDEAHQRFLHDLATDIEEAHSKGKGEGIAIGEARGEAKRGRSMVLKALRKKFSTVSEEIEEMVGQMSDPIALESLLEQAIQSDTLEEFTETLR
jgi:predicted transposase/invertase (TIGR01784 family)